MEVEWSTGWGPTLPREDSWTESVPIMPKEWDWSWQRGEWLEEHAPHKNDEEEANTIIEIAANEGSVILAESILPEGVGVVEYIHDRAQSDAIEWLLDNNICTRTRARLLLRLLPWLVKATWSL
ncbi:hypothetical protein GQ600_8548 [Phytophthora cactorum]|nr:hypothetical protein GQ600_8548 [Phytophthora cactorum]